MWPEPFLDQDDGESGSHDREMGQFDARSHSISHFFDQTAGPMSDEPPTMGAGIRVNFEFDRLVCSV